MKTKTLPVLPAFLLLTLSFSVAPVAWSQEVQAPAVLESFLCNYNDGKDYDDLMAARDFYVKQSSKAGITRQRAVLWQLYKGDVPFDFVWFNIHSNLGAFAASSDAEIASAEMAAVGERFDKVAACSAGMGTVQIIHQPDAQQTPADNAFVSSSACRYRPGVGDADMSDLNNHISEVMKDMGDGAPDFAAAISPFVGGPDTPDVVMFNVNQNATQWANFVRELVTKSPGQALGRHFDALLDCRMSLFLSEEVVAVPQS